MLLPAHLVGVGIERKRHLAAGAIRFYLYVLVSLDLCEIEIEKLPQDRHFARVIVYNHPTIFDALIAVSHFPSAVCIAKSSVLGSFLYGLGARLLDYIPASSSLTVLERAVKQLDHGYPCIIFPEGTRSGEEPSLHRSAARIALDAKKEILVGLIEANPPVLGAGTKWYQAPKERVKIKVRYIRTIPYHKSDKPLGIQSRQITTEIHELFLSKGG